MVRRTSDAASVAQKLCDLLLQFPDAAIDGIHWNVLVRKFEDRFSTKIDLTSLGFNSALAAAPALLWDVGQIRDAKDSQNPIVALEDAVALTPRPGSMGSWPSLYKCLCDIVKTSKSHDGQVAILLSQLKPLLQSHWHSGIDEHWGYFDSKGASIKTKKMKHLVQAVLKWRNQRVCGNSGSRMTALDEAFVDELELVPSSKHNDLLLRLVLPVEMPCCSTPPIMSTIGLLKDGFGVPRESWADMGDIRCGSDEVQDDDCLSFVSSGPYDDPFEPPPQKDHWARWSTSSTCSTPSHFGPISGSSTPMSQHHQAYTFMPVVLCNFVSSAGSVFGDICSIPSGTVQHLRTQIEGAGAAGPLAPASQWAWK